MQKTFQKIKLALSEQYCQSETLSLARIIIEHLSGLSLPLLLLDKNTKITQDQEEIATEITERLLRFEPIQHILGESEFYGLNLYVNRDVLIPRPETEELVELIISKHKNEEINILDIGTGSGAIAIALKKHLPNANIEAWDISAEAIKMAKKNAETNSTEVLFNEVDILSNFPTNKKYNIIVSNPPYILDSEKSFMSDNVLKYEPHLALFVPDSKPLLFYSRIADVAIDIFNERGFLYFEINQQKGLETESMLKEKGYKNIKIIKDISQNDRIVKAEFYKSR